MIWLQLTAGLLLLLTGGELLVRGAVATAMRAGVSPLLIGLTLVGFGTSTPELLTSVEAALVGAPGIAVGNVIGSNTANILLILGLAALIYPLNVSRDAFWRDGGVAMAAAICGVAVCLTGDLTRIAGALLLTGLIGYLAWCYYTERTDGAADGVSPSSAGLAASVPAKLPLSIALIVGGLALTMLGAHLLVSSALLIGLSLEISEAILGVTVVAVGTSLPEMVTSLMAAWRRQPDIAFGNIVGSNIYNILGILGITAVIEPIPVPPELVRTDIWVMLAATVMLLLFSITGWRISRTEGAVFVLAYAGYILSVTTF